MRSKKLLRDAWKQVERFEFRDAHHLVRRAGFGGSRDDIARLESSGVRKAVDHLLDWEAPDEGVRSLDRLEPYLRSSGDIESASGWWLLRMVRTDHPLREKLCLFWHNHFATSFDKVQDVGLMLDQYRTFSRFALGPFEPLLHAMARDPAMILWLDGNENRKGHANENFARELMELFSLGIGNYTEEDVQEAARAFSGWHVKDRRFHFRNRDHDHGTKRILGHEGPLDGDDVIRVCACHPSTFRFLASKLLRFFVHPEPDSELVESFAQEIRESGGALEKPLRMLFSSRVFYSDWARGSMIKGPTDFLVGIVRALRASFDSKEMSRRSRMMGQALFRPPTVKGWDGDRHWMSSSTWLAREAALSSLLNRDDVDLEPWFEGARGDAAARKMNAEFFDDTLSSGVLEELIEVASELVPERASNDDAGHKALAQVALMLPEFHRH